MAPYKYAPLRRDHNLKDVRLLNLWPGPHEADIHVDIFHTQYSPEKVKYEALSYVWGSPQRTESIVVEGSPHPDASNGLLPETPTIVHPNSRHSTGVSSPGPPITTLAITENLSVALRHLRRPDACRILWVDCICINQDDVEERSVEVGFMGNIFRNAVRVIVWLGAEGDLGSLAVKTFVDIGQDVDLPEDKFVMTVRPGSPTDQLEKNPKSLREKVLNWIAIRSILQRTWFTRLWVVQEIGLAEKAVIKVGHHELQWRTFKAGFFWVWKQVTQFTHVSDLIDGKDMKRIALVTGDMRDMTIDLLTLLDATKYSHCLDPRDRIYAILSLLPLRERMDIKPDYSKDVEYIYKDFAVRHVRRTPRLTLFHFSTLRDTTSTLKLPSWIPDLSVPNQADFIQFCDASGISEHEAAYVESSNSLRIRGLVTATITHVTPPVSHTARVPEILAIAHTWEPSNLFTSPYVAGGSLLDAFVCTLISGYTKDAVPPNSGNFLSLEDCKRAFMISVIEGKTEPSTAYYVDYLQSMLPGRAFFTTREGYIGLCPDTARPGDQVVVILGCATPLLLRPAESPKRTSGMGIEVTDHGPTNARIMVGECYVHGLMWCEAFLGPLPTGWVRRFRIIDGFCVTAYVSTNRNFATQHDPRFGRLGLPQGWRARYGGNWEEPHEHEFDAYGNMRRLWFENVVTGKKTWWDPRLTSECLRSIGLDIRDFHLV
ncbi:heterokaryon incompatibility protein-domain-containing protein [Xylogone sp. PMI_703]|nr:heterokaryon incompatibility protein-domain-containing protein [Xylogone sp. PMI_703]